MRWKIVTSPKKWGGLGIKDLKVFNRAFNGQMTLEVWGEVQALWKEVIVDKYGILEWGGELEISLCLMVVVCERIS